MQVNGIPYEQWKQKPRAKPKVEFMPEIWGIIKEFAGIYHIGTQWNIVSKLSGTKITEFYRWVGVTDPKIVRRRLHGLRKYKTREAWKDLYTLANGVDLSKYKNGDTVKVHVHMGGYRTQLVYVGVVIRITKKTVQLIVEAPFPRQVGWRSTSIQSITKT